MHAFAGAAVAATAAYARVMFSCVGRWMEIENEIEYELECIHSYELECMSMHVLGANLWKNATVVCWYPGDG